MSQAPAEDKYQLKKSVEKVRIAHGSTTLLGAIQQVSWGALKRSKDRLGKLVSKVERLCRTVDYPESLSAARRKELLDKMSGDLVTKEMLAEMEYKKHHDGSRLVIRKGDIIPLGLLENHILAKKKANETLCKVIFNELKLRLGEETCTL